MHLSFSCQEKGHYIHHTSITQEKSAKEKAITSITGVECEKQDHQDNQGDKIPLCKITVWRVDCEKGIFMAHQIQQKKGQTTTQPHSCLGLQRSNIYTRSLQEDKRRFLDLENFH